ncbi:FecR domain-containing protein [Luteimonas sp. XNQY3]|nr:FecR domain-containing protein [Luteimonas sp. XNQY3]MCD9004770.1 FecR domain-containing protein [Luteimonas sp. XNQY3]
MSVEQQAADWVAREDRGPLSGEARAQRDAWLAASPRHLGAYARAHAAFVALARVRAVPAAAPAASGRRRRLLRWSAGLAATVAACALAIALHGAWPAAHRSADGISAVDLPDGSRMVLNADSEVRLHFDAQRREVALLRGEAMFEVRKDPTRRFVVTAGRNRVVAIGTAFSVQRSGEDDIVVLVREGLVDVSEGDAPRPVRVASNFRARTQAGGTVEIEPLRTDVVDRHLAWSHGMLAFEGDTLAQAAAQFARYSEVRILIDEPQVAQQRVAGLYAADDPEGFARAVATSLGLRMSRDATGIHLHAAPRFAPAVSTQQQ